MIKKRLFCFALFCASIFNLCSAEPALDGAPEDYYQATGVAPFIHQYVDHYSFEGDSHGQFKGDLVAVLEDGSAWKVHPKHTERFLGWTPGQTVHVAKRDSFYWFKREHKMALINHDLDQEVYVMMVATPLTIYASDPDQPSAVVRHCSGYYCYNTYERFRKNICLSNGYLWEIDSTFKKDYFAVGTPAYVAFNIDKNNYNSGAGVKFFLINGLQREADVRATRPGNYYYYFK